MPKVLYEEREKERERERKRERECERKRERDVTHVMFKIRGEL